MPVFNTQAVLSAHLEALPKAAGPIGLVPTMGALHKGHLSLLEASLKDNGITVISIFVNPTQFNNPEDLLKYPRTLVADVEMIHQLNPSILIFAPSVEDIYNGNTESQHFDFDGLENQMEGRFRPGHFDGVGTIVKRLFEIIKPDNAYFGEKDFQQLQIIRKLAGKYHLPVNVVGCPIYREENGLAMSSRNELLTKQQRDDASVIYRTLHRVKSMFGIENAKAISDHVKRSIESAPGFELEYFEIATEDTLMPITSIDASKKYRAFIAVFVNKIRLIDTVQLN